MLTVPQLQRKADYELDFIIRFQRDAENSENGDEGNMSDVRYQQEVGQKAVRLSEHADLCPMFDAEQSPQFGSLQVKRSLPTLISHGQIFSVRHRRFLLGYDIG